MSILQKEQCLHPDDVEVQVLLNQQSPDIKPRRRSRKRRNRLVDQGYNIWFYKL